MPKPKRVGPYFSSTELNNIIKALHLTDTQLLTIINSVTGNSGVHTITTLVGQHTITVKNGRITDWDEP